MAINTNLQEDIKVLQMAGFTKDEIVKNLSEKGFSLDDIHENMTNLGSTSAPYEAPSEGKNFYLEYSFGCIFYFSYDNAHGKGKFWRRQYFFDYWYWHCRIYGLLLFYEEKLKRKELWRPPPFNCPKVPCIARV